MGFLFPLFLGGLLLASLPYIIHHIRRPERKVVRFSSLMFVPKVKKEVVERRRLQHLLLMLLRMLLIALLALAFSRPYRTVESERNGAVKAPEYHLILVDVSHSMGADDLFEKARKQGLDILAQLPNEARVGVVAFEAKATVQSALDQGDAGQTHRSAQLALENLRITQGATQYLPALRMAESLLLSNIQEDDAEEACVLHMISDFRKSGMPLELPAWRLSGRINFQGYQVGEATFPNLALEEVAVRTPEDGPPVVVAKVKNYGRVDEKTSVTLAIGDQVSTHETSVSAGNASLLSIPLENMDQAQIQGRLSLPTDRFDGDNDRYFLWREDPGKRVWLVGDATSRKAYGDAWILDKALKATSKEMWQTRVFSPNDLLNALNNEPPPDALIVGNTGRLPNAVAQRLNRYLNDGGAMLLCAGERPDTALLKSLGMEQTSLRFQKIANEQFEAIAWVDFDHPVFYAFRSARFNDFSSVRFNNYRQITWPANAKAMARIGHKNGEMVPAIAQLPLDQGRLIVWSFSPSLKWTNLPKHVKLLPMLGETMNFLAQADQEKQSFRVGETYPLAALESETGQYFIRTPDGQEHQFSERAELTPMGFTRSGFLDFRTSEEGAWESLVAVNVAGGEGDPEPIPVSEFALKLTSNSQVEGASDRPATPFSVQVQKRQEWGYWPIALLFPLILLETLYALFLSRKRQPETVPG